MSTGSQHSMADIVIVGAGHVGLPLAHALSAQGWRVLLLDALNSQVTEQAVFTEELALRQRCIALSLGTQQWLMRHGLWDCIAADATPIQQVHVSQKGRFGVTRLRAHELNADAVGYVVDNSHLVQRWQHALGDSRVEFHAGVRVVSVAHQGEHVSVTLDSGAVVKARLLLAADGVSSIVRESLGIATTNVDYQQAASMGMVKISGEHQQIAYERFTDSGPLAMLPRNGPYMSFVDCIDQTEQDDLQNMSDTAYLERMQLRFGYRLGRFEAIGPRHVMPLNRVEAQLQTAPRSILLGNAARLLHPVGGQGYNLAMRDVSEILSLLAQRSGSDPGDHELLKTFVKNRRSDQKQTMYFTDALARGFRGKASGPGHLRGVALLGLDTIPQLRKQFASFAMGLAK